MIGEVLPQETIDQLAAHFINAKLQALIDGCGKELPEPVGSFDKPPRICWLCKENAAAHMWEWCQPCLDEHEAEAEARADARDSAISAMEFADDLRRDR